MSKDYKGMFKELRNMQEQLWRESMASFPGAVFPGDMNEWQQKTLENVNSLVGQAVSQALEMQREWMDQWMDRAGGKKVKPKLFADLSAEAVNSTQRWLDNQNQLLDQWLQVVRASGGADSLPGFDEWEKAVQDSIQRQIALLGDWSDMSGVKKLSTKEVAKLSSQIEKSMQKSIETQQRLWSHWFEELAAPVMSEEVAADAQPKKKKTRGAAGARKAAANSAQAEEDLKQISGIGPGLEKKLKEGGISTLRQLAELSDQDIAHLEENIIRFSGRVKREKWVEQARKLVT
ncbi:MAG: helix-hairpin-helix domain-containing protein [Sedimenticolaceae bacterium]|jgi:predicted flap endonuclease-1-like 5' DNA nuclease